MLVRRVEDRDCPFCGGPVGVGLKEEPSGWKVYRVCLAEEACRTVRVGSVPRTEVSHLDDVVRLAEKQL